MIIKFDRDLCRGHAQCAAAAPDVYPLDGSGYCDLPAESEVSTDLAGQARRGARQCPEQAITTYPGDLL
jgi:ferredoxin